MKLVRSLREVNLGRRSLPNAALIVLGAQLMIADPLPYGQGAAEPPAVPLPFFYNAAQRAEMENKLPNDAAGAVFRSVLISACARDNVLSQAANQILWFIEHQPEHWVLTTYGESSATALRSMPDGEVDRAKALWDRQLAIQGDRPLLLLNAALFLKQLDFSKAIELLEKARRLQPKNPVFVHAEARAFAMQPDVEAIRSRLLAAADPELLSAAGWAFWATSTAKSRESLGLELMEKAVELDPGNRRLRKAMETAHKPTRIAERAVIIEELKPETNPVLKVTPVYPPEAKSAREQGPVVFTVVIDNYGFPTSARLIQGDPLLVQPSTNALRQWVFKPFLVGGTAASIMTAVTFNFAM